MANILIVYYYKGEYPLRSTSADHLYSFNRYAPHQCFYLNVALRDIPLSFRWIEFDLIVFTTLFLSLRWNRALFREMLHKLSALKASDAVKIAQPQDEFLNTDLLCDFINEFGVTSVLSVAPESEWPKIYSTVDSDAVSFQRVLTGYLADHTISKIKRMDFSAPERRVDIGYRAYDAPAWLGRHGMLKAKIADVFREAAAQRKLVCDISTRASDTFLGDAWYEFLLRCKYMIGVEGGASLLDRDGSIRARTDAYTRTHPTAGFDEIEAACFPEEDGKLDLFAISPRHLEACATRTCQVLLEGEYNGILRPGDHYIEVRQDFSNLPDVLNAIERDDLREIITARAWEDIVVSDRYSYRSSVKSIVDRSLAAAGGRPSVPAPAFLFWWLRLADRLSWIAVMIHWYVILTPKRHVRKWLVNAFSEEVISSVMRRIKRKVEV
jgi:hypothetical protein